MKDFFASVHQPVAPHSPPIEVPMAPDLKLGYPDSQEEYDDFEGPSGLPVCQHKSLILKGIEAQQVTILVGPTGSGKTTQIPQFLSRQFPDSRIVVTQPRRVAALSLAARVCSEMRVALGTQVGVAVRFKDVTSRKTRIKFCTDGILLQEAASGGLNQYTHIIIDEAHERSMHTDLLLGLLKKCLPTLNAKIILMSATLNTEKFENFFGNTQIIRIPGRQHQIYTHFLTTMKDNEDFIETAYLQVCRWHVTRKGLKGDVLVFLPGYDEIHQLMDLLNAKAPELSQVAKVKQMMVIPFYSALSYEDQEKAFQKAPKGCRKIILATNIAETSITLPGVNCVIDCGRQKLKFCDFKTGLTFLKTVDCSKEAIVQRRGRAGREGPGACFHLFTKQVFDKLNQESIPEILRVESMSVLLDLLSLNQNPNEFDFVDCPDQMSLMVSGLTLRRLGAITTDFELTERGKFFTKLPLHPLLSNLIYEAYSYNCVREILIIVGMLTSPLGGARDLPVFSELGDHLSLLLMYEHSLTYNNLGKFCTDHNLSYSAFSVCQDIIQQLMKILNVNDTPKNPCLSDTHKCLAKGLLLHGARMSTSGHEYQTLMGQEKGQIHPSSVLSKSIHSNPPSFIVYHEFVSTSEKFFRFCTRVEESWLAELRAKGPL